MESLTFTGTQIAVYLTALLTVLVAGIIYARYRLRRPSAQGTSSPLIVRHRTKHPAADTWQRSGIHFRVGLAVAIAVAVLAINWTTFEERPVFTLGNLSGEELIEVAPPPTNHRPPPPPPPPPPPKEIVVEEDPVDEQPAFTDTSIDRDEPVVMPPAVAPSAPPPPPPPPPPVPEVDVEEIRIVAEYMPRFAGCADVADKTEAKACSEQALFKFLKKRLVYPRIPKENGIQETVVLRFVIERDGSISDLTPLRGRNQQLVDEALRVAREMPDWTPGKQNGRPVRVQFTLPIRFKLQ